MPYSSAFPYSSTTQRIAERLPSWMKARDPQSNFQQLANPFGLQLDELSNELKRMLDNLFIGSARLEEVDWIQKADLPPGTAPAFNVSGLIDGIEHELRPTTRLRHFLEADDPVYLLDEQRQQIFFRPLLDEASLDGVPLKLAFHHVWNAFDEIALLANIRRRHLETNAQLKRRILYAFRYLPTVDRKGISAALANFCSLIDEITWPDEAPSVSLTQHPVLGHTIRINDMPALPGQWDGEALAPKAEPLHFNAFHLEDNTWVRDGRVSLAPGKTRGVLITPLLRAGNLKRWTKLSYASQGRVRVEVLSALHFEQTLSEPVLSSVSSGSPFPSDVPALRGPIFLRISLRRNDPQEESPYIEDLVLEYLPAEGEVSYLYGVELHALHEEAFKKSLFNEEGQPLSEMRRLVAELNQLIPVLWDLFRWDEAFWDIIEENLVGLDTLPTHWDGTLEGLHERYLQPGIGFGTDLEPRMQDWSLQTYRGHYFQGEGLAEHYLFADPKEIESTGPIQELTVPSGEWGTPYAVLATRDGQEISLRQVAFLGEDLRVRIDNEETLHGTGKPYLLATYGNLDIDQIQVEGDWTLDPGAYQNDQRIPFTEPIPEGETVKVTYRIKDSFVLVYQDNELKILLSEPFDEVRIIYEQGEWRTHSLHVDPLLTHWRQGFAYIAEKEGEPARLRSRMSPSALLADGLNRAMLIVDVADRWDNPVYGASVTVSLSGSYDDETPLDKLGTLTKVTTHANRHIWRYDVPDYLTEDATLHVEINCGSLQQTLTVRLRKVET